MRKSEGINRTFGKGNTGKGRIVERLGKDHQGKQPAEMSTSTEEHRGSHHQEGKARIDQALEINTEAINEARVRIQEGEMTTAMADRKETIVASEEEEEI